jgi:AraC-like DNA-binding protein
MGEPRLSIVAYGRETCDAGDLPRHRHVDGYLTLVLSGSYVEAGDAGRFRVREGDVLIHGAYEAHQDMFGRRPANVLNLPFVSGLRGGVARVADPDAVVRLASENIVEATALVCSSCTEAEPEQDWPDLLAEALRRPDPIRVGEWARLHGLAPATVSRGFRQAYGTTAARYRAEARTRLAFERIRYSSQPLIDVAFDLGFADQAHMTRSLSAMTGLSARRCRYEGQTDSRL